MTDSELVAYVKVSAVLQGLVLDEAQLQRVAQQLARTAKLAQLLDDAPLAPQDELAEIYHPSPFAPAPDRRGPA